VGISGGKDSLYALYWLKDNSSLRVEAFTYVHDGLEKRALDNAQRAVERLGVEHHLISLPKGLHRDTTEKFFRLWTESESPVSAAMTCVACKHLHRLGAQLATKRNIPLMVWATCPIEFPPFVPTGAATKGSVKCGSYAKFSVLLVRLLRCLFQQPELGATFARYLGTCARGCLSLSPESSYMKLRFPSVTHLKFYDYIAWNGDLIVKTLQDKLGWEQVDWHADCSFHVLKEYMFQKMYLCSYTDSYLSNQIRCGMLSRIDGYHQLLESKQKLRDCLPSALARMGMDDLSDRIDVSCFSVT
jgi:hypothetical protein